MGIELIAWSECALPSCSDRMERVHDAVFWCRTCGRNSYEYFSCKIEIQLQFRTRDRHQQICRCIHYTHRCKILSKNQIKGRPKSFTQAASCCCSSLPPMLLALAVMAPPSLGNSPPGASGAPFTCSVVAMADSDGLGTSVLRRLSPGCCSCCLDRRDSDAPMRWSPSAVGDRRRTAAGNRRSCPDAAAGLGCRRGRQRFYSAFLSWAF